MCVTHQLITASSLSGPWDLGYFHWPAKIQNKKSACVVPRNHWLYQVFYTCGDYKYLLVNANTFAQNVKTSNSQITVTFTAWLDPTDPSTWKFNRNTAGWDLNYWNNSVQVAAYKLLNFWNHVFLSVNFLKSSINNFYIHVYELLGLFRSLELLNLELEFPV